jgi:hypothetical protein
VHAYHVRPVCLCALVVDFEHTSLMSLSGLQGTLQMERVRRLTDLGFTWDFSVADAHQTNAFGRVHTSRGRVMRVPPYGNAGGGFFTSEGLVWDLPVGGWSPLFPPRVWHAPLYVSTRSMCCTVTRNLALVSCSSEMTYLMASVEFRLLGGVGARFGYASWQGGVRSRLDRQGC